MVTNLFNGKVSVKPLSRNGAYFNVTMYFTDDTNYFKGSDVQIGDVLFIRAMTGRYFRLVITAIEFKNYQIIKATVHDETGNFNYLVAQNAALVRETPNRKYPMFPNGIPSVLRSAMMSYYAVLADAQAQAAAYTLEELTLITDDELLLFAKRDENSNLTGFKYIEAGTFLRHTRGISLSSASHLDGVGYTTQNGDTYIGHVDDTKGSVLTKLE